MTHPTEENINSKQKKDKLFVERHHVLNFTAFETKLRFYLTFTTLSNFISLRNDLTLSIYHRNISGV